VEGGHRHKMGIIRDKSLDPPEVPVGLGSFG